MVAGSGALALRNREVLMFHVLVLGDFNEVALELLDARDDVTYEVLTGGAPGEILEHAPAANAIMAMLEVIDRSVVEAAPSLRVVSRHGVGFDTVDVDALTERGIPLAVTATGNAVSVAEHAMSLLFAVRKQTVTLDRLVRDGRWSERGRHPIYDLHGTTLLILGFGRIGRQLAVRAKAFGIRVQALDPWVSDAEVEAAGGERVTDLHAALAGADAVSLHLPLSEETRGMFDAAAFAATKPGAVFINTARGGLVDEDALCEALRSERLAAAGLDTLQAEPPPDGHPLLALPNVVLSPHAAGMTEEARRRMATETAINALAGLDGRLTPEVVVNRSVLSPAQAGVALSPTTHAQSPPGFVTRCTAASTSGAEET